MIYQFGDRFVSFGAMEWKVNRVKRDHNQALGLA